MRNHNMVSINYLTGLKQDFVSKNEDLGTVFDRKVSYLPNEMFYRTMVNCDVHQLKWGFLLVVF